MSVADTEFCDTIMAIGVSLQNLHAEDIEMRDENWRLDRRTLFEQYHKIGLAHDRLRVSREEDFAKAVTQVLRNANARVGEAAFVSDFTTTALERLREPEQTAASSQEAASAAGPQPDVSPKEKYLTFFLAGTGRTAADGALGSTSPEPEPTQEQKKWKDEQWAMHWLVLGGFEPSPAGAAQVDDDGWLPLHHAIQATQHWTSAHNVCRGLMQMMPSQLLKARTAGGRPSGYTCLHLASNNSDKIFQKRFLVHKLLERNVDVNATDTDGERTALHFAAGTGQVDVAKVLVEARADIRLLDRYGKNALDKALGSSSQMKGHSVKFVRARELAVVVERLFGILDGTLVL